jgi:hypothetical protein
MDLAARWQAIAERQERRESLEEIAGMPSKGRKTGEIRACHAP